MPRMSTHVSFTEYARRICEANHVYRDGPVPCGQHLAEAQRTYGLIQSTGSGTLKVILQARREVGLG